MMRLAAGRTEGGRSVVMVIYRIRALTGVKAPRSRFSATGGRHAEPPPDIANGQVFITNHTPLRARVPTEI